jgi:hypothetical protein
VRHNHTYDIRYDTGDELRLIGEKLLRLPPAKGDSAAILEVGMVFFITTLPVSFYVALNATTEFTQACVFAGILVVGVIMLIVRVELLINYEHHFKFAGLCNIFRLTAVYLAPTILMIIAGAPNTVSSLIHADLALMLTHLHGIFISEHCNYCIYRLLCWAGKLWPLRGSC